LDESKQNVAPFSSAFSLLSRIGSPMIMLPAHVNEHIV
jgi:hypothetical protein